MAAARELTAMKIAHEVSLKSITASYEASIKDLNAEHVQAISDIGRAHDTKIKTAVAKLREENTELKKGNTAKVTEAVRNERQQSYKTVKELEKQIVQLISAKEQSDNKCDFAAAQMQKAEAQFEAKLAEVRNDMASMKQTYTKQITELKKRAANGLVEFKVIGKGRKPRTYGKRLSSKFSEAMADFLKEAVKTGRPSSFSFKVNGSRIERAEESRTLEQV